MDQNKLILRSPVSADFAEYNWSAASNAGKEITKTIKFVLKEFNEFGIDDDLSQININNFISLKNLCDKYNQTIDNNLQKISSFRKPESQLPSTKLLKHILKMCYNYSISDPQKLNTSYKPFSKEVYGETSFEFVQQMIETCNLKEDDEFIDLGSGVGQVVLHVAAAAKCRCVGIEISDLPAEYAKGMENRFKFWINWFGKIHSDFELHKGDFLQDKFVEMIRRAKFIFTNNLRFGDAVNLKLKEIFKTLSDGVRIFSSNSFRTDRFLEINSRNYEDFDAMVRIEQSILGPCSWTAKKVPYYLHTIDSSNLMKFCQRFIKVGIISAHVPPETIQLSTKSVKYTLRKTIIPRQRRIANIELSSTEFEIGDLVWSQVDDSPFWPAMVVPSPNNGLFHRLNESEFFVEYFGNKPSFSWNTSTKIIPFLGYHRLAIQIYKYSKKIGELLKKVPQEMFNVHESDLNNWNCAIAEAHEAMKMTRNERIRLLTFTYKK